MLFAAHETFHLRDGWLFKGLSAIENDPLTFADPYATDTLGVGRNMVRAIRYWLVAAGLATETTENHDGKRRPKVQLSKLGRLIMRHDPHLEDEVSAWLVHFSLCANVKRATAWYWTFNHFPLTTFDAQTFLTYLSRWVSEHGGKRPVSEESLRKDLNCVLRTYAPSRSIRKSGPEDGNECPLTALGLIDCLENSGTYRINVRQRTIPPSVMAYAAMCFANRTSTGKSQVSLRDFSSAPLAPGRIFALSPDAVVENLDLLEKTFGRSAFRYVRTAGMNLLEIKGCAAEDFLSAHFKRKK